MHLTLRTMLALRNGLLHPSEAAEIAAHVEQNDFARQLLDRAETAAAGRDAAPVDEPLAADPNKLAEYLDNALPLSDAIDFENHCLGSGNALGELLAVHRTVSGVPPEPAPAYDRLRARLLELGAAPLLALPLPLLPASSASSPIIPPPIAGQPMAVPGIQADFDRPAMPVSDPSAVAGQRPWRRVFAWYTQHANYYVQSAVVHLLAFVVVGLAAGHVQRLTRDGRPPTFDTALGAIDGESDTPLLELGAPAQDSSPQQDMPLPGLEASTAASSAARFDHSELFRPDATGSSSGATAMSTGFDSNTLGGGPATTSDRRLFSASADLNQNIRGTGPPTPGRTRRKPSSAAAGGVVVAQGVDHAVDGILTGIHGELSNHDLLVVWLLDASLSLYDDRQLIAARIEPFYREIDGRQAKSHLLMNAAVAFGAVPVELVAPTRFGLKILEAVADTPIDSTGLENVMTAVEHCVANYRKWKGDILIVIWTDESGDDTGRLEEIIALCRRQRVVVSVVGPSSAFGSEIGVHPYLDRATGYRFLLPIKRGPDTSFAERLQLPYWHDSLLPPWTRGGAQVDQNLPWYGGPYREGLLSGVGPYALTRLALQTGGTFTLLDHAFSAGPFKFETMKPYLPDYGSAAEYVRSLKYHPLRQAVLNAVQLTYQEQSALTLPKMSFISVRSPYYPFAIRNPYTTAGEFRQALAREFAIETAQLKAASLVLEQAIACFGADGMERQYKSEPTPRWRAWYDLTRGRLLAMSVRYAQYVRTCELVLAEAALLNPNTNHIVFEPSARLKSTVAEMAARAAEAERLLNRCIEQNPDTPWSSLAQWELDHPFGLSVRQVVIPPPQPSRGGGRPPAPVPTLPKL